ncbi:hypothetical protein GNX71_18505 [Variovorax sp. RKNM96]|uniref:hypothetical protein n=1 Tax=Variovorax sp. RKNM96 TaxID=2681552 RepID=UPI00197FB928|nr:hypothetical protein [Variovorax sp. RKNM96]QSI31462.1 hypothetical protein GNX71_18505 [Variovorax sp. RKNM96]
MKTFPALIAAFCLSLAALGCITPPPSPTGLSTQPADTVNPKVSCQFRGESFCQPKGGVWI